MSSDDHDDFGGISRDLPRMIGRRRLLGLFAGAGAAALAGCAPAATGLTSIFPACYDGRWPHVHFEVYASQAEAASSGDAVRTTQLALPREVCEVVYATPGYERSVSNLAGVDLDSDTVFGDGHDLQVPTVTGGAAAGYTATLAVPV